METNFQNKYFEEAETSKGGKEPAGRYKNPAGLVRLAAGTQKFLSFT